MAICFTSCTHESIVSVVVLALEEERGLVANVARYEPGGGGGGGGGGRGWQWQGQSGCGSNSSDCRGGDNGPVQQGPNLWVLAGQVPRRLAQPVAHVLVCLVLEQQLDHGQVAQRARLHERSAAVRKRQVYSIRVRARTQQHFARARRAKPRRAVQRRGPALVVVYNGGVGPEQQLHHLDVVALRRVVQRGVAKPVAFNRIRVFPQLEGHVVRQAKLGGRPYRQLAQTQRSTEALPRTVVRAEHKAHRECCAAQQQKDR